MGVSLKLTNEKTTFYNTVQYCVDIQAAIIYWSFLYTFKASGVMSQEKTGHLNFETHLKDNIAYVRPFKVTTAEKSSTLHRIWFSASCQLGYCVGGRQGDAI